MKTFEEIMEPKRKYFAGWLEEYSSDEGVAISFAYTKGDYNICISVDCQGWTLQMRIEKKGAQIVYIGHGDCEIPHAFNKNNIKKRVKKAYKKKGKRDRTTGLNIYTNDEDLADIYIEFLFEHGILENTQFPTVEKTEAVMEPSFKELMEPKRKCFVGWQERYTDDSGTSAYIYTKSDYKIGIGVDGGGLAPQLFVDKNDKQVAYMCYETCRVSKELSKNGIAKRVKNAHKAKSDKNKQLIDVYIEFLIENGILENK